MAHRKLAIIRRRLFTILSLLSLLLCITSVLSWVRSYGGPSYLDFSTKDKWETFIDFSEPGTLRIWRFAAQDRPRDALPRRRYLHVELKYRWICALTAAFPCVWLLLFVQRMREQRRRRRAGLCPKCGYDLRATPERCPECGSPAAPEARST